MLPLLIIFALFAKKKKEKLIWGTTPILSYKYWSEALKENGYQSLTLMKSYYSINKKSDYDIYYEDLVPKFIRNRNTINLLGPYLAFLYIIRNAAVIHTSFHGVSLGNTLIWKMEALLLKLSNIKIIITPYGSDAYMYSKVIDLSVRNGLLLSYPNAAKMEGSIIQKVSYWNKYADIVIVGFMVDGLGRWDVLVHQLIQINTKKWLPKDSYSKKDGINGAVRVIHTPNHRGFKGTEFIIDAVDKLKKEGYKVELILLEKVPNDQVLAVMQEADVLAEQLIFSGGYALSGIEGMATGLPVLANISNEAYTRVFRRYSFLNECPILSTNPENIQENLRILVTNPELREELGRAGRAFVEKYHSYETAQYLFSSVYDKILHGKDVDLMTLFHPLKSKYNMRKPYVQHPLFENQLPSYYYDSQGNQ